VNLTISIGRNVGNVPLSDQRWEDFRAYVGYLANEVLDFSPKAQLVQSGIVDGYWDGKREESYTITVADASRSCEGIVADKLREACTVWEQDSIAATWYEPTLIER